MEKGELTELDVQVSKLLFENRKRLSLEDASLSRALDLGRMVILVSDGVPGLLVGKDGRVAKTLSKALGKHLRVVSSQLAFKDFVEQLLLPVKPAGINTVFRPEGQTYRVRISRKDLAKLPTDIESLRRGIQTRADRLVNLQIE